MSVIKGNRLSNEIMTLTNFWPYFSIILCSFQSSSSFVEPFCFQKRQYIYKKEQVVGHDNPPTQQCADVSSSDRHAHSNYTCAESLVLVYDRAISARMHNPVLVMSKLNTSSKHVIYHLKYIRRSACTLFLDRTYTGIANCPILSIHG